MKKWEKREKKGKNRALMIKKPFLKTGFLAIVISVIIFLAIVVLTVSLITVTTYSGVSQKIFCRTCHVIRNEFDALKKSPHKDVPCLSCHGSPGVFGFSFRMADGLQNGLSYVFKTYKEPIVSEVSNDACLRCHYDIKRRLAVNNAIQVSHKEFLDTGYKCSDCHNTVAHGDVIAQPKMPYMDKCTACHNNKKAPTTCGLCHMEKMKREVRTPGPWAITHGPTWERTHGMGNLTTCIICHETEKCERCHIEMPHPESWPYIHGDEAKKGSIGDDCCNCHLNSFCEDCHRFEMPHPFGFLPGHPGIVKKNGDEICYTCHIKGDCNACHERHMHPGLQHLMTE
ncbi:cytochrome c3 family protein [Candidatus Oleimmundimicrobium sp.]|uniref:cytochrome c3 family protein n=1 Tax=Candidatus Oleimmundimicrobium sp. TaxID=3060597 RepID=UPI0027192053|nr:cytochrome c3 family protein [Candidatus Oleimmundimicrobium sp.]MDO8886201.1 cytochrome c3 family protein [Candidatus Oleimmundimicrobium sp.]